MPDEHEIPIGFTMKMAMNQEALEKYATMTDEEKARVIDKSRTISSKGEMDEYIDSIAKSRLE